MSAEYRRVPTEFGPETRFEVRPFPVAPFRAERENEFERLKGRLLAGRLEELWDARHNSLVRRAANEAAALAYTTPVPLLVFPVLFAEKTEEALLHAGRQERVYARSRELLTV